MAYPFRGGPQSPRDDPPFPSYSNNPLSPQRNPNRLSGGMLGASTPSAASEARAGLTRRFTTNALPTLSPIGQQRRAAAGDTVQVSARVAAQSDGKGDPHKMSITSPGLEANKARAGEAATRKRGNSLWESIEESRFPQKAKPREYWIGGEKDAQQNGESKWAGQADVFNEETSPYRPRSRPSSMQLMMSHQNGAYSKLPPSEQKYRHYEQLLAEQRRIQAFIEQVDPELRKEVDENLRHELAVSQMLAQSEPTTPPEYADAFPSALSKPNRYSTQSLTSPPGIINRPSRASTQLTSPPTLYNRPYNHNPNLPSQSVPGSRRQSDDEEDEDDFLYNFDASVHRAAANPNRNSMPVTSYDRKRNTLPDYSSAYGPVNTTSFLFDDEDKPVNVTPKGSKTSPSDGKTYLQVQHTADGFPKLIRREENGTFADPSAALDLALNLPSNGEQQLTDRVTAARNRISLPPSALRNNDANIAGIGSVLSNNDKPSANNRRSVEFKLATEPKRPGLMATPPRGFANGNNTGSYSTNDLPTMKSLNPAVTSPLKNTVNIATPKSNSPRNNQASGTTSNGASSGSTITDRQSQDSISQAAAPQLQAHKAAEDNTNGDSTYTGFQGGAAPFNPTGAGENFGPPPFNPNMAQFPHNFYGMNVNGYGMPPPMHALNNGFGAMNMNGGYGGPGGPGQFPMPMYQQPPQFGGFQPPYHPPNAVGGATRMQNQFQGNTPQRRGNQEDVTSRFATMELHDVQGEIVALCSDQHGCRFLQRKLDEREEASLNIIFDEVHPHIVRLMTDPFGNYLCQKLLENCKDDQRTILIRHCMGSMSQIALNQHGTRALQKMIEFISTPEQTNLIIEAMRFDVVQLIQDLNGNHVIQKCLNHLSSTDAQFIFDAVGARCIEVGTHRHGCCVLQRCVDHASGAQKGNLVRQISEHAFNLVQDPFGNYVVQYILDIAEPAFTEPICQRFLGNIVLLSKQKFSSNVIEKCIRCASEDTRRKIIGEIVPPSELEKLLRDSFANYVVQTAFDYSDDDMKVAMAESLRPILPSIRHTPYGRRLSSKIQEFDGRTSGFNSGLNSGVMTPEENSLMSPSQPFSVPQSFQNAPTGRGNRSGFIGNSAPQFYGNGGGSNDIASPQPKRHSGNLGGRLSNQSEVMGITNGGQNHNGNQSMTNGSGMQTNGHLNGGPTQPYGQANTNGSFGQPTNQPGQGGRFAVHKNPYRFY